MTPEATQERMVSKSPSNAALRSSFSFFFEVIETTLATCNKCGEPPPQPRCSARAAALTFQWSAPSSHTVSHVLSVATGKKTIITLKPHVSMMHVSIASNATCSARLQLSHSQVIIAGGEPAVEI